MSLQNRLALLVAASLLTISTGVHAQKFEHRQVIRNLVVVQPASQAPDTAPTPPPAPASCDLPWGGQLTSGSTYSAAPVYATATVNYPATCNAVSLTCTDGTLSVPTATLSCKTVDTLAGSVQLLLHLDTSVADAAGKQTVTAVGAAKVVAGVTPLASGGSSLYLNGNGDYLALSASAGDLGAGDFTVEAWVRPETFSTPGSSGNVAVMSAYSGGGTTRWLITLNGGALSFGVQYGSQPQKYAAVYQTIPLNTWSHVAAVRKNGYITVYLNGVGGSPVAIADNLSLGVPTAIGRYLNANYGYLEQFKGSIDEVRVTKGVARYSGNFTPPTAAYPNP